MDELDDIRAYIENEDCSYPKLEDLVARWDSLSPDERSHDLPHRSKREHLIISYTHFSHTKRWAWGYGLANIQTANYSSISP